MEGIELDADIDLTLFGTISLGTLIGYLRQAEKDAIVMFDFCGFAPTKAASYRGYYDHLALGYEYPKKAPYWPMASTLAETLSNCVGETFEGYKGGTYRMDTDTPVWVDNPGDCTGTGIIGIEYLGDRTILLKTAKVD